MWFFVAGPFRAVKLWRLAADKVDATRVMLAAAFGGIGGGGTRRMDFAASGAPRSGLNVAINKREYA